MYNVSDYGKYHGKYKTEKGSREPGMWQKL